MITEIFVENKQLDVSGDISSLLTYAIDDVKDFSSRQTTFSKTVILPGTANNNAIFGNIFDTGISNNYDPAIDNIEFNFNPAKSARCVVFQDNLQTFKGTLRILEIDIDKGRIEYQVALNGDLTTLNVALSSAYLTDLDFSAYDRSYTVADIIASWDNAPGSGIYYPLIDYGTYSALKHDWDIRTFKPALYVKEFIDKMFTKSGFTYESDLFNTDRFKRLIVPYNKKIFQGLTTEAFSASRSNNANYLDQASFFTRPVQMTTVNGTLFAASASNSTFTYVGADPLLAHFTFSAGNRIQRATHDFYIEVWLNGVAVGSTTTKYPKNGSASPSFYSYFSSFDYTILPGQTLQLIARCDAMAGGDLDFMQLNNAGIGCTSTIPVLAPVGVGDFYKVNQGIPNNVRQVDFLVSIVKLFNLYVYESKFDERLILISPFIDFYNQSSPLKAGVLQCEASSPAPQTETFSNSSPGNIGFAAIAGVNFTLTDSGPTGFKRITYTGADTLIVGLDFKSEGFFSAPTSVTGSIEFYHVSGATTTRLDHYPLSSSSFPYAYGAHFFHFNFTLQPGDYFYVQVNELGPDTDNLTQNFATLTISTNVAATVDWTYKLNRDKPISIKPLSELNSKLYNFNYKSDSDYWNDLYQKRYNQIYGSYIFDSQYEFADQTNNLELIFAPTPLVGYDGEDKVYPTIFKRTGVVTGEGEENVDSVIRIMQTKKIMDVSSYAIKDGATVLSSQTAYGYAGHLDDPDNPDNDLNFGALLELFFVLTIGDLSKTQFNIYWSSYMAEITDKDSKLLTGKFYLTPIDIFNLDFSQYVYLDGVLYRLNKITDYNVTIPSDCEVQLLKVINTSYSFPAGSRPEAERTIDWDTDDQLEYTPGNAILYL